MMLNGSICWLSSALVHHRLTCCMIWLLMFSLTAGLLLERREEVLRFCKSSLYKEATTSFTQANSMPVDITDGNTFLAAQAC